MTFEEAQGIYKGALFRSVQLPPKRVAPALLPVVDPPTLDDELLPIGTEQANRMSTLLQWLNAEQAPSRPDYDQIQSLYSNCIAGTETIVLVLVPNEALQKEMAERQEELAEKQKEVDEHNAPIDRQIARLNAELKQALDEITRMRGGKDSSKLLDHYFSIGGAKDHSLDFAPDSQEYLIQLEQNLVNNFEFPISNGSSLRDAALQFARILQINNRIHEAKTHLWTVYSMIDRIPDASDAAQKGVYHVLNIDGSVRLVNLTDIGTGPGTFIASQIGMLEDARVILRSPDMIDVLAKYSTGFMKVVLILEASMIPGIAEGMDYDTLKDSDAPMWARSLAGVSLLVSLYTFGSSPNAGPLLHAGDNLLDAANQGLRTRAVTTRSFERASVGKFRWWDLSLGVGDFRIATTRIEFLDKNLKGLQRFATAAHETVHLISNIYLPNIARLKEFMNQPGIRGFLGANIKFIEESIAYTVGGLIGALSREGRQMGRLSEVIGPWAAWSRSLKGKDVARRHVFRGGIAIFVVYEGCCYLIEWSNEAQE